MKLATPLMDRDIEKLSIGDTVRISGEIFCGRDAVLPRIVDSLRKGRIENELAGFDFCGAVIFHTAVSPAGVGPTSSNKLEIESSMVPLSRVGVKLHLGKGRISNGTIEGLDRYGSMYAIIPPITALLRDKTISQELVAFPELGMEAFYKLKVHDYPAIIAAVHGRSIYD